jgi:hypothetical protein
MTKNVIETFSSQFDIINDVFDRSPASSICFECCLQIDGGIAIDFTIVVEFYKKAVANVKTLTLQTTGDLILSKNRIIFTPRTG